jgi:hypothetical protein
MKIAVIDQSCSVIEKRQNFDPSNLVNTCVKIEGLSKIELSEKPVS